jgi:hypothetical protein
MDAERVPLWPWFDHQTWQVTFLFLFTVPAYCPHGHNNP